MEAGEDNKSACGEVEKKIIEKLDNNADDTIEIINYTVDAEQQGSSITSTNINESDQTEPISTQWKNTCNSSSENMIKKQEGKTTNSKKHKDAAIFKKKFGMSDSDLVNKKTNSSGFAKILQWDPWHKIRRNKKKDKHKKFNKKNEFPQKVEGSSLSSFDMKSIEESVYEIVPLHPKDEYDAMFNPRKHPKTEKNVRFQSDVTVVLFGNDQILGETVEPLKKELEQQERNKELRKEVCPEGFKGGNWKKANDYMSSWYIRRK